MTSTERADEPQPGRLESLGEDIDREDAEDLLGVFRSLAAQQTRDGRFRMNRAAREALWWIWEQRRLPRPLIRGKYPVTYPWSPGARAALAQVRAQGLSDGRLSGVIIEHLYPARITMEAALAGALDLDVDEFLTLLRQHGAAAVITRDEDLLLSAAGLTSRMPSDWDGIDSWARARAAGLVPSTFEQIQSVQRGAGLRAVQQADLVASGHSPDKLRVAHAIADRIEAATGWQRSTTVNQITFRDAQRTPIRVQFWGERVRLELGEPTDPALNPLAPRAMLRGKSGRSYWLFSSNEEAGDDLAPVLELVGWQPGPAMDANEAKVERADEVVGARIDESTGRSDFGVDVDAAIRQWGKYDGFREGTDLVHRVLAVLEQTIGGVTNCFTPPSNQYVAIRLAGLQQTAMTVEAGRVYVTPPAVAEFADSGRDAHTELSAAGIASEPHERGGLSVWTSRGVSDRASATTVKPTAGMLCGNPSCSGAFVRQPAVECSYCGEPLTRT